jgi:hypothetical protein
LLFWNQEMRQTPTQNWCALRKDRREGKQT